MFQELNGMKRLAGDTQDLRESIDKFEKELFAKWLKKIQDALRDRNE
jgi:hypothetical protein